MPRRTPWLIWLVFVMLVGVVLRCIGITDPYMLDFHSWRQTDTAAFTHSYLTTTLNPLDPRVDAYPCEHRNKPFGRVEAELPVAAWVAALPLAAMGVERPPPPYLRAVSILFYLGTCIYLFLLVLRLGEPPAVGVTAVFVFSVLPLSAYFTRTVQPDGPALFFSCGMMYYLTRWLDTDKWRYGPLSALFGALAFLQKISAAYLVFPVLYHILSTRGFKRSVLTARFWIWGLLLLAPVVAWYKYASTFAWTFTIWEGKYATLESVVDIGLWRVFGDRLVFEILTPAGVALLFAGCTKISQSRAVRVSVVWLLAVVVFIALTIPANHIHIYYQLPLVVPASIVIAVAAVRVFQTGAIARLAHVFAIVLYAITAREALRHYHSYDGPGLDQTVKLLKAYVPRGSYIVSTNRDPRLYYNADIRGWFLEIGNLDLMRECMGSKAQYLLLDQHIDHEMRRSYPSLITSFDFLGSAGGFSLWCLKPSPK